MKKLEKYGLMKVLHELTINKKDNLSKTNKIDTIC